MASGSATVASGRLERILKWDSHCDRDCDCDRGEAATVGFLRADCHGRPERSVWAL